METNQYIIALLEMLTLNISNIMSKTPTKYMNISIRPKCNNYIHTNVYNFRNSTE